MEEKLNTKYIDHLTEDDPIDNQKFVCLSFLSPEGIRNCSVRGLKVRGVFMTREDAEEHIKTLQLTDPDHDIFIGEVGKWLPWDPDPNSVQDRKYQEEELQKIEEGYKKNLARKKQVEEKRKKDLVERAAKMENQNSKKQQRIDRMKRKLAERQAKKSESFNELESALKEKEETLKKERELLGKAKETIDGEKAEIDAIDRQLREIREMHKNFKK